MLDLSGEWSGMMDLIEVQSTRDLPEWSRVYTNPELAEKSFEARYGRKPERAYVFKQTTKAIYYYIELKPEEVRL